VGTSYARVVTLDAEPPLDPAVANALASVLEDVLRGPAALSRDDPWRRAGLTEAVEEVEPPADYALSPRSTRGATRA
jgi:hypothetical protein